MNAFALTLYDKRDVLIGYLCLSYVNITSTISALSEGPSLLVTTCIQVHGYRFGSNFECSTAL